jgi:uncharacterized OB-fold protein
MTDPAEPLRAALALDGEALDLNAEGGPRLMGTECAECGQRVFPPTDVCPACMAESVRPLPLSRSGTLYSYSVVHAAPKGWSLPFIAAYVDLPDGVRVFAHIVDADPAALKMDSPVTLTVATLGRDADGAPMEGFAFKPEGGA